MRGFPCCRSSAPCPIALVVSELLTNAVKHAFAELGGTLRLCVERDGTELRIRMEDDGPGLPSDFDLAAAHGVGMRVVTALLRQLGGGIEAGPRHSGTGAAFLLSVPLGGPMTVAIEIATRRTVAAPSEIGRGTRAAASHPARILIVEDEALVGLEIQAGLESVGHEVVGIADRAAAAESLARLSRPELALIDMRLAHGDSGLDVATSFARLGIPCLFITGNCPAERALGVALGCLHKPFDERQLVEAVRAVVAIARGGPAPEPAADGHAPVRPAELRPS